MEHENPMHTRSDQNADGGDQGLASTSPATLEEPNKLLGNVRRLLADIDAFDQMTGTYTSKADARQTGVTVHLKFENRCDALDAARFANFICSAPGLAWNVLRQLEAALLDREDVTS